MPPTTRLYVGVQTWGVAGNVGTLDDRQRQRAWSVGFAPLNGGSTIPATCPTGRSLRETANVATGESNAAAGRGPGLDGFNVATYTGGTVPGTMNLLTGFGTTLTTGMGNLAFAPEHGDTRL